MRYKLIDVGRRKFNGEVFVTTEAGLLKEVKKHLASKLVDIFWDEHTKRGTIFAGFRPVGYIETLEA